VGIAGDSSGGTIALAAALRGRDRDDPPATLLLLAYPALDPSLSGDSYRVFAEDDFLSRGEMEWYWAQYLGREADVGDPLAAPACARNLVGLPPIALIQAGCDVLRTEGEAFAERLQIAGVPVTAMRYDGMPHGFLLMSRYLDGAREAVRDAAGALATALGTQGANG
jgi:acetyl esterase